MPAIAPIFVEEFNDELSLMYFDLEPLQNIRARLEFLTVPKSLAG